MVSRVQVVNEARGWLNVPFRHMGRSRQGVDCVGLIVVVCNALDIPVLDWQGDQNYDRTGAGFEMVRHCMAFAHRIKIDDVADGDMVIFNSGNIPCHVGLRTTRNGLPYVIQALGLTSYQKVVEQPWAGEWRGKARFAFRLPGVED